MKVESDSLIGAVIALLLVVSIPAVAVADEQKFDGSTPLEELRAAASGGDAGAMLEYGSRLLQGQGIDTNSTEGLSWIQKAADAGNAQAWYTMGFVYSNGLGVEQDFAKAVGYYRQGAESGDADCQTAMGMFYQAGGRIPGGIETDPTEAARWYGLAAEQDHTEAIQHLAVMYSGQMGSGRNDEEALRWFRKGADLGNADCIWGLGRCYLRGQGVKADSVMAYALCFASLEGIEHPQQKKAMTAKCDQLGKALTAEQLEKAKPITEQWKAKIRK